MQIRYRLSCTSFLKAWSLRIALAQQIVLIQGCIRFSIIILISFIKEGVRDRDLGQRSCLFRILSYKPKQASHFLFKIILWLPRSVIRKGMLYYLYLLIQRQIHKIVIISGPIFLLYPRIGTGLGGSLRGIFKNSASFTAH